MSKENVSTILVAKFMGLGSIVHATPMLRAIKKQYPDAKLLFLTRKANRQLFRHMPDVDEVFYVDDSSLRNFVISHIQIIYTMIIRRLDVYFDLELFSTYGALMSLFSMARNRMGFFCSMETDFKARIYTHLMYFNFQIPIRVCYLQLARLAHISPDASSALVPPHLDQDTIRTSREKLSALLGEHRGTGVLCFNVNASDLCLERRWPGGRFVEVARHFAAKGYIILFVGSAEERPYIQSVMDLVDDDEHFTGGMINVAGYFEFSEFLAVLPLCDAILTNETGIMNLSYWLGGTTLSLFGPCTSIMYRVDSGNTRFIEKSVYCRPCLYHLVTAPCQGENVCMLTISTGEVIETLEKLLRLEPVPAMVESPRLLTVNDSPLGILRTRKAIERKKKSPQKDGTSI